MMDTEELRDVFAGQAIGCFTMGPDEVEALMAGDFPRHDLVAKFCYGLADAMLYERKRRAATSPKGEGE